MRKIIMIYDDDPYVGKICASSDNTLAFVTCKKRVPLKGLRWFGYTLDGNAWKSKHPRVVYGSANEYADQQVDENTFALQDKYMDMIDEKKSDLKNKYDKDLITALDKCEADHQKFLNDMEKQINNVQSNLDEALESQKTLPDVCGKEVEKQITQEKKSYLGIIRNLKKKANKSTTVALDTAIERIDERSKSRKAKRMETKDE